jgi:hypothetical protein
MIELKNETIWFDQRKFEEAESHYQRSLVQKQVGHVSINTVTQQHLKQVHGINCRNL